MKDNTHTTNAQQINQRRRRMRQPASMSWQTFLKAHREAIFAVDYTTVEVWTKTELTTFYVMVVMKLKSRRVEIAGVSTNPNKQWVTQVARNLSGDDGFLESASHLILDRDTCFQPLRSILKEQTEIEPIRV